MKMCTYC